MLLYKFRTFDQSGYALDNLKRSNIWCSSRDFFNDPYEFAFELERHPEDIDKLYDFWLERYPHWRGQLARKAVPVGVLEILNDYVKEIGVCCFTTDPMNVQMWSHYANSHTGFCLGFDFGQELDLKKKNIFEVKYTELCPKFPISVFMQIPYDLFNETIPFLTSKHTNWEYEKEWRYLYNKSNTAVHYNPTHLKEILFGMNCSQADRQKVEEICREIGLEVRFKEVLKFPRSYEIGLRNIYDDEEV